MKTHLSSLALGVVLFLAFALGLSCALTGQPQTPNPEPETAAAAAAVPAVAALSQSHPWMMTLLAIMAALRVVFKPIVSAIEGYVQSTPSTEDDAFIAKVEASRAWKVFAWLLDYFASVKIGPQFTAKPSAPPTSGL